MDHRHALRKQLILDIDYPVRFASVEQARRRARDIASSTSSRNDVPLEPLLRGIVVLGLFEALSGVGQASRRLFWAEVKRAGRNDDDDDGDGDGDGDVDIQALNAYVSAVESWISIYLESLTSSPCNPGVDVQAAVGRSVLVVLASVPFESIETAAAVGRDEKEDSKTSRDNKRRRHCEIQGGEDSGGPAAQQCGKRLSLRSKPTSASSRAAKQQSRQRCHGGGGGGGGGCSWPELLSLLGRCRIFKETVSGIMRQLGGNEVGLGLVLDVLGLIIVIVIVD